VVFPLAAALVEGRGGAGRTRRRWELKRCDGGEDDERRGAGEKKMNCSDLRRP